MKKRHLYVVCLAGPDAPDRWKVTCNGEIHAHFPTQAGAIAAAVTTCRSRLKNFGDLSELKIMGLKGTIRDSRTYGKDPAETKG
jgi:hypothetical protein